MNYQQKTRLGLDYIFDLMSPDSPYGQALLRSMEFYPKSASQQLRVELDNVQCAVDAIKRERTVFWDIQSLLCRLKSIEKTFQRLKTAPLDEVELFELKVFLTVTGQIKTLFDPLAAQLGIRQIELADTQAALKILSVGQDSDTFFISADYSQKLKEIRSQKQSIQQQLRQAKSAQKKQEYIAAHLQIVVAEEAEEFEVRQSLSTQLRPFCSTFCANAHSVARLDLLIQKAQLALKHNAVKPILSDNLSLKNMISPALKSKLEQKGLRLVPTSIAAKNGVTVITGANMGGKTTILKTLALNVALAHCGFFVFADSAQLPHLDFIQLLFDDLSSAERGLSSFAQEVSSVNELYIRTKAMRGLILIDEFANGTNADEGTKIFNAVAAAFNATDSIIIMTTHFDSAAVHASTHLRIKGLSIPNGLVSSSKDIKERSLVSSSKDIEERISCIANFMDYTLIEASKDAPAPRDAITVCRLLGIDAVILRSLE